MHNSAVPFDAAAAMASPPLPDQLPATARQSAQPTSPRESSDPTGQNSPARLPEAGCYLTLYTSSVDPTVGYFGTLRVARSNGQVIASGDLYQRDASFVDGDPPSVVLTPAPDPAAGIPVFPIGSYRYYLRVTAMREEKTEAGAGFSLAFELYRFSASAVQLLDGSVTSWPIEVKLTAVMTPESARDPSRGQAFAGNVATAAGTTIGRLSMQWVSPYLRRATVEIDRVPASDVPRSMLAEVTWQSIFDKVGWDVAVVESDSDVEEPSGGMWNRTEAHKAMRARREKTDLSTEWRYHIFAVRRIALAHTPVDPAPFDKLNGERGFMYDETGSADDPPREGLMIASDWEFPQEEMWGPLQGMRARQTVTYFRTAVHELGHAMGLEHNTTDHGFMCPTDVIAQRNPKPPAPAFPDNMEWSFAPDDEHRLRHWPDLIVRPGGTNAFTGRNAPINRFQSDKHRLECAPSAPSVPLGAPVCINLRLVNTGTQKNSVPASLSLQSGTIRGQVIDPYGTARPFLPLALDESANAPPSQIDPGSHVDGSLALLAGRQGILFPLPGAYRIVIEASWTVIGLTSFAMSETRVSVSAAPDAEC